MEVFSPDEDEAAGSLISAAVRPPPGPPPGPPLSPTCQRSSASMLHRLLTLPSQLLDDDEEAAAKETLGSLAFDGSIRLQDAVEPPAQTGREEEEEEEEEGEEEDEEDKGKKRKRRRVWSECEDCGRRFSRISLLKAHRQTHSAGNAASSPPAGAASPLRCSDCGKRFSSATRLHSHIRTQHHSDQS